MGKPSICRVDEQGRECKKCGEYKAWEDFRRLKHGVNGRSPRCKTCMGAPSPKTIAPMPSILTPETRRVQDFLLGRR